MAQKLDRTRPLWEMWLVEGLDPVGAVDGGEAGGRPQPHWALVSKGHHCMVDGISGTDPLNVVLDVAPEPSGPVPDTWSPGNEPSSLRLAADALVDYVVSPYEQAHAARSAIRRPRRLAFQAAAALKGATSMLGVVRSVPPTSLAGLIGPHRRYAWARTSLQDVKAVRTALGGTVNDVVLAAVTRGFRDLIIARGEDPQEVRIRSLVPVSVRRPEERGTYNNRVSAMFAELPVHLDDPVERLVGVRAQMGTLKDSGHSVAAETVSCSRRPRQPPRGGIAGRRRGGSLQAARTSAAGAGMRRASRRPVADAWAWRATARACRGFMP